MGVAAEAFEAAGEAALDTIDLGLTLTIRGMSARLIERSIVGNPALWLHPAPKDYHPGTYRSNWNYGVDRPNRLETNATGITVVNGLEQIPERASQHNHYLTNSLPYARALEFGHSTQGRAIAGLTAIEFDTQFQVGLAKARAVAGAR